MEISMFDAAQQSNSFLQLILDSLPMPLFVVDNEYRLVDWNPAANEMIGQRTAPAARTLCGEGLGCLRSEQAEHGCGTGPDCSVCVLRGAVEAAMKKQSVIRQRTTFHTRKDDRLVERHMLVTSIPLQPFPQDLALLLIEDVTEIDALRELVPICASCKKIRNDQDYWEQLEGFMGRNVGMVFTHGLCPDCAQEFMEEDE